MEESDYTLKEYDSDSIESTQNSSFAKRKQDTNDKQDVKKLKKDNSKYKQPTAEELNNFREVENLFNSVLLKSEIDDLLLSNTYDELKRTQKTSAFEKWFKTFTIGLNNITEYGSVKTWQFLKNPQKTPPVQLLINNTYEYTKDFTVCDNTKSRLVRPESVDTFGGYKSGASLKRNFTPNVVVKMPRSAFYEKDFINNRYLIKRFHYLLYLMYELKNKPYISQIDLENYQANVLMKTLIITPDYDAKVRIRVFVVPESGVFKLSRMAPDKNNIKVNVYTDANLESTNFSGRLFKGMNISEFTNKGTAMYNTLLLHDFTLEDNYLNIDKTLADFTCCQQAIKLLLIWLKQRQLITNYTSFTSELLIYTIIYLIQRKKINRHMSCYQVVRVFFIFISETDWRVKPISLSTMTDFTAFTDNFDVTFTDSSGFYNLTGFLHAAIYQKLKLQAAMALQILTKDTCRAFLALFKTKMPIALQYDCVVYFNDDNYFQSLFKHFTSDEMKWKYFGFYEQLITHQFLELLKYGLGSRVDCIVSLHVNDQQFNNCSRIKEFNGNKSRSEQSFVFGLMVNPHHALNPLIIGPQQYDVDAVKFKDFWRDLVSLRRFPNTSIHEAVYFDKAKTVADKRDICGEIVRFIANKLNVRCNVVCNQFDGVIRLPHLQLAFESGTNEEVTKIANGITDELFTIIRNLTLPEVSIEMLQCVSDVYCGTDPFPPVPCNYSSGKKVTTSKDKTVLLREVKNATVTPRFIQTIDCIMHIHLLNKSSVDNLEMYHAILASTYAAISKSLPNLIAKETYSYIDVLYKGLVFRIRAYNDREVALLKRMRDDSGQIAYRSNDTSLSVEREGNIKPKLYGALNGLYRQYPCFGAATALAKRWLRSQLLHYKHINDMTVNLLMAAVFLSPEPFDRPALPQVAFTRFLRVLAEFPFDYLPVVVNFNSELNKEEVAKFESEFLDKRASYNAVHIITLYDSFNSVFTKKSPDSRILRRIKLMAEDALIYINTAVQKQQPISAQQLFTPNTKGFDVIINIYSTLNAKRHLKVLEKIEKPIIISKYDEKVETKFPVVAFNPVDSYLRDLEQRYGVFAYFFHDVYGGNFVGVLWNRDACNKNTEFKTSSVQGRILADTDLVFAFDATLSEFITLSQGLVKEIIENEATVSS